MKTIALLSIIFPFVAMATTYTSIADGMWNNTTTVWSTNGVTPCLCYPSNTVQTDSVIIKHIITLSHNTTFKSGAYVELTILGLLNGNGKDLTIENAEYIVKGNSDYKKLNLKPASIVNVYSSSITASTSMEIEGVLTLDDSHITTGLAIIRSTGTINFLNNSKFFGTSGNLSNYGTINLGPGSCFEANSGNLWNYSSGVINGTGAVYSSSGNITNENVWDNNLSWCASGLDTGLPATENCTTTDGICASIVPLPIELLMFEGAAKKEFNELSWETSSEQNCDYFLIQKSNDCKTWNSLTPVKGAGNSSSLRQYNYRDESASTGIVFYRLVQYDYDGKKTISNAISLETKICDNISIYPNPTDDHFVICNQDNNIETIEIYDLNGSKVFEQFYSNQPSATVQHNLKAGIYFVNINQQDYQLATKLIVE